MSPDIHSMEREHGSPLENLRRFHSLFGCAVGILLPRAFPFLIGDSGCVCSLIRFQYVDGLTQIEDFFCK